MIVDNLPPNTKLIWDAPELYEGYAKKLNYKYKKEGRIYYPCITTNNKSKNPYFTCHLQIFNNDFHWLKGDLKYLRFPTQEELDTIEFPIMRDFNDELC